MTKLASRSLILAIAFFFSSSFQVLPANAADTKINSLVKRLNTNTNLWQINTVASSSAGAQSRMRLGLFQQPNAVIECNLRFSGTWLFVYKSTDQGYKAASSSYFVRANYYAVEIMIDPKTQYIVLVHTSMGGNQQCLNSAYKVLSYIGD